MPFEVVMPRLGWNMEAGSVGQWLKRDGDYVNSGELLFTVEGDKATQEVEAFESGILRIPPDSPPPGKEVPVGTLLGYLLKPGEAAPFSETTTPPLTTIGGASPAPARASTPAPQLLSKLGTPTPAPTSGQEPPPVSPRARRVASELGVDWTALRGSGRTGRIVERDIRQAAIAQAAGSLAGSGSVEELHPELAEGARPGLAEGRTPALAPERSAGASVSPLARRRAEELGVDVEQLAAKMPGKRIERGDVEAAAAEVSTLARALTMPPTLAALPGTVLPITSMRRITAERMAASAHTVAPVTLTTEADATELVRLRGDLKADGREPVPSYNDLFARLVATALTEHPTVNARFDEGGEAILQAATVNIGIAVDTERGLLVPVLRDVQTKSLRQIARESAALIERARGGRIGADELRGGTFTITNLGMYEIDAFTPIINLPECAVLGIGRIIPKQVVLDPETERVAIRHMVFLSLTFDHRLVDGAPAARFLQRIKQFVERPYLWLVG